MRHGKSLALATASVAAIASATPAAAQTFFLGQILEVGATYCPRGFASASGQLLSIQQNTALFSLLGTTYGGNGVNTFALPDIRGRMVIGDGQLGGGAFYQQGQISGQETVTLTSNTLPSHSHAGAFLSLTDATNERRSFRNAFATTPDNQYKTPPVSGPVSFDGTMHSETLTVQKTGTDGVPIPNMSPFLVTQYCVVLQGIFPSRN
ncbi:phage tail protein [Sphingopyxis sp. Root1497]|uniref:phage tail protein n=1 Tax=Sphingopyxis sp. Root1497 TaxID=1736474 RepID=UPI0009EABF9F|nr:tail fiber protein [Sphingopyxis sp. Root1497]